MNNNIIITYYIIYTRILIILYVQKYDTHQNTRVEFFDVIMISYYVSNYYNNFDFTENLVTYCVIFVFVDNS